MNKPNTTCRVCGKEYFCCGDSRSVNSWRTMACSPECFQEYMRRIDESRKPILEAEETKQEEFLPKTLFHLLQALANLLYKLHQYR